MKRGELGRRGLSPLIATILLIAFAAALGTLVMSWALPGERVGSVCDEVSVEFQQLSDASAICYSQNTREIRFVVANNGDHTISYLRLRAVNRNLEVTEEDVRADLQPGRAGTFNVPYETASPNGVVVSIIPALSEGRACTRAELERTDLPLC